MKNLILLLITVSMFVFMTSCDVDQTRETKLPDIDVDIDTKAGQLPKFDVDWAEVNVGTKTKTIMIPKVVVVMEEEEIEVPYIDVDMPDDKDREEHDIIVEAEVGGKVHALEIQEVYATGKRLYVISKLEKTSQDLGKEKMRVSDRLILNAPDLDVKHYIIGERPDGAFNRQYSYIANKSAINKKLQNGKKIYSK